MRTRSRGERETGERCEHERVRQIEIQRERERQARSRTGGGGEWGVGGGGHQHTEAVCGLPSSSSSSKNRGEEKQRWFERLNSCWNRKCREREGQILRQAVGLLGKGTGFGFSADIFKGKFHYKILSQPHLACWMHVTKCNCT